MPLDEVVELFDLPAPADDPAGVQTLGGVAMAQLGRVPVPGDRLTWRGLRLEVLDMDGWRVDKLLAIPATAWANCRDRAWSDHA